MDRDERVVARAWADLKKLTTHWWWFRLPAAGLTAGFAVWGALLKPDASAAEQAGLAVGGTLGGALVVGLVAFGLLVLRAPVRQRDEARDALDDLQTAHMESRATVDTLQRELTAARDQVRHQRERERVEQRAEEELVAIINAGKARYGVLPFDGVDHSSYVTWRDAAAEFIDTVFGPVEKQRFHEAHDPPGEGLRGNLDDRLRQLAVLRDHPDRWEIQVDAEGLETASKEWRRIVPAIDQNVTVATDPTTRVERLRTAYDNGRGLLNVFLEGPQWGVAVREWAMDTWTMLRADFPAYESEFFGNENVRLGRIGVRNNVDEAIRTDSLDTYLRGKLDVLAVILKEHDR